MTAPKITLKNFKHAEFASHETTCFEATVYVDGKIFCMASDEGQGGEVSLEPHAKSTCVKLRNAIHKVGLRINPNCLKEYSDKAETELEPWIDDDKERWAKFDKEMRTSDNVTSYEVVIYFINEQVTRELYRKDLKKLMVKKVVWLDKKDDKIYNTRNAKNAATRDHWVGTIQQKYDCVILNAMDKEEALDLFIAKCA